jgi:trk system potassium uptake protein TrkA
MKVIIMGCGRVGEALSRLMSREGHDVTVIDYDEAALNRLDSNFKGRTVLGAGFDRNILIRAGIEQAEAFAATSASDNANIVAARIARNLFHVPKVVARLFDPSRAEIYQRLGLVTISSANWGAERIHELLTHTDFDPVLTFGSGEMSIISSVTPLPLVGRSVKDITVPGEVGVVAITREGKAIFPSLGTAFRPGDLIHFVILASALERFESMLGLGEGG